MRFSVVMIEILSFAIILIMALSIFSYFATIIEIKKLIKKYQKNTNSEDLDDTLKNKIAKMRELARKDLKSSVRTSLFIAACILFAVVMAPWH